MYELAYKMLGGEKSDMSSVSACLNIIRNGLPISMLESGSELLGITNVEYAHLIGDSLSSIQRKIKTNGSLSPASSEHVLLLTELARQADEYFCDQEKRKRWFSRSNAALGNVTPLSICDMFTGINLVNDELNKLKYGFTA